MEGFNQQKWEDLNLSKDELKNFGEALQKEEFRNLLLEYVKEINDPENRKQYEQEITQLENERGVNVKFIHPSSGYVIKSTVDGKGKVFVNICSNHHVKSPSSTPSESGGNQGSCWSIPYCLAPPREDFDKKKQVCTVFDVVFHPETLQMTKSNTSFKKLVNETALKAIEDNFQVCLDKINLKFPKMQFKGAKHPTVIREKIENFQSSECINIPNYPYPPLDNRNQSELKKPRPIGSQSNTSNRTNADSDSTYTTPKYTIKHRNTIDIQDFTNDRVTTTLPKELVVSIDLPLLKHSSDASVDVTEKVLSLISNKPAKYKLEVKLPYKVDSNLGNAKFDTLKKVLIVTLPVVNKINHHTIDFARDDSGVESDNCNGKSNSPSSDEHEETENSYSEKILQTKTNRPNCNNIDNETSASGFLKPNIHYTLPKFCSKLLSDMLSLTLHVPSVNPESVSYCFVNQFTGFHLTFSSMGAGFFPVNYSIYMQFTPTTVLDNKTFIVEVWDNNVLIQVKLLSFITNQLQCYVGIDQSDTNKCIILNQNDNQESENENSPSQGEDSCFGPSTECDINENHKVLELQELKDLSINEGVNASQPVTESQSEDNANEHAEDKHQEVDDDSKLTEEEKIMMVSESGSSFDESSSSPQRQPIKSRTLSESHDGNSRIKYRGILKVGRSLSESSVDDYASWSNDKTEKTKKTVRFSEVISRQTFRMNSSILGQRKKNQRKMKNKKRAQERRLSESGNESEGENEEMLLKHKNSNKKDVDDWWYEETKSSSCDVSEVSDLSVSDVSESDDGQIEEQKFFLPCSSKKNHRRRGKKSARKNAATAKLQFMEC